MLTLSGSSPCVWGQERYALVLPCVFRIIPMRVGTRFSSAFPQSLLLDHPHACGDKRLKCAFVRRQLGSSPCVWGQGSAFETYFNCVRIIPMRVGTSSTFYPSSNYSIGSSPCVWGQANSFWKKTTQKRIIPMRVGTSNTGYSYGTHLQDHPHACGDKCLTGLRPFLAAGSSPCVWGQVSRYVDNRHFVRIIPMRVGTSFAAVASFHSNSGSSPCVWGQAKCPGCNEIISRIIPMRVGTRYKYSIYCRVCRDHPHACGDKNVLTQLASLGVGSSPCVWGQVSILT